MTRRWARLIVAAVTMWSASGCTLGPNFTRPATTADTSYLPTPSPIASSAGPSFFLGAGPSGRWWTAFGSSKLDALVERALARNASLDASDATLAAAREEIAAARGRRLPQVDASARAEHERVNLAAYGFEQPGGNPEFTLYSVGGGITYDLDLFGGNRRRVEAAAARAEAQLHQSEAAHLALAGQVVNQVMLIAAIRSRIAVANALLDEDRRDLDLTQKRRQAGEGTLVEVINAQSQYDNDRGDLPALDQQLAEARHLLATLTGVTPASSGDFDIDLEQLSLPASVPVTIPSMLARKRPDILQAEAELHEATAALGIAAANLYPNVTLGATATQGSPALGDLLSGAFRGFDLFAGVTAPIFHGGTLRAERRAAIDRARAADATYHQTVLEAFRQIADLLSAMGNDGRMVSVEQAAVATSRRSLALSRRSFEVGNSGVLQILESERLLQQASSGLIEARSRQLLNVARLYVATAGGWVGPSTHQGGTRQN